LIDRIYTLIQDGKYQEAILEALTDYDSDPSNIEFLVLYVNLLINHGFFEKAEQVLDQSQFDANSDISVHLMYRDLYSRSGKLNKLEELARIEHGLFPLSNITHLPGKEGVLSYNQRYFSEQVLEFIHDLFSVYNQSHKDLKKAYLRSKEGMISEAVYHLTKYSKQITDSALRYLVRAELALVKGDYAKAKKMYGHLAKEVPYKLLCLNRLGDISNALGENEKAHQYYKSAIEMEPDHQNTQIDLIKTSILEGDLKTAKRYYNQVKAEYGENKVFFLKPMLQKGQISNKPGTILGLVWSEITGNILPIEILIDQVDQFRLSRMGNIGYLMRDSINTVMSVIGNSQYGSKLDYSSVKINVPKASIFKDGPSAGLALIVGAINRLQGYSDLQNHAFTGEISLSGKVLPVGGISEKVFGAYMNDISNVFLPAANHHDLRAISNTIKTSIQFHFVSHYEEAIEKLWMN